MVAGPSGAGKTIMGLHFIYGGAEHGERGIIATLQENPTQLTRALGGLGWPLADPGIEVMYRSPVDIYIDEWIHQLLEAVERTVRAGSSSTASWTCRTRPSSRPASASSCTP